MSQLIHSLSESAAAPSRQRASSDQPSPTLGRPDSQTAKSIEVSLLLKGMLGESAASAYLARHAVDAKIVERVLNESGKRRGSNDADSSIA